LGKKSYKCPRCGSMYPRRVWKNTKSIYATFYFCPDCETKHHWNDLRVVRPKDV